jgi:hypothetical protein
MTHVGMSRSAMCLPRKTTLPLLEPSKMKGFAAFPIGKATPQENPRIETRHVGGSKRAFRTRPPQIFTSCSYKKSHQFSSCVTKCQACHAICTLSTVDAGVTVRFVKITQRDTSEVLPAPATKTGTHLLKYCASRTQKGMSSEHTSTPRDPK